MAEIYQLPEGGSNNNSVPAWLPYVSGNNGGLLGGNGLGSGALGFIFGLLCGNGGFGNGIFGGGNNNANATMLANAQQYLMEAINHNGERATSAIQNLANVTGQNFNFLASGIQQLTSIVSTIAANQGMNVQQILNGIQSGNQAILSQFQQCCCQQQLALANMQGSINTGLQGIRGDIASKAADDRLNNCQLRYDLTQNDNANARAIIAKIDQVEDSRKDREITALTAKVAQLESQNTTAAMLNGALNPIIGQLAGIKSEVDAIKRCQPQTITLPNNSMTAVPTIWANAVADNIVDKISAAIANATATATGGTTTA